MKNNPAMQILMCEGNRLKQLDVDNNPELASLNCSRNDITQLDVSSCERLCYYMRLYNRTTDYYTGKSGKVWFSCWTFQQEDLTVDPGVLVIAGEIISEGVSVD